MKAALLLGCLLAIDPAPADACSCAGPRVFSAIEKTAPINARITLWIPHGAYKTPPTFTLREPGTTTAIDVERRDLKGHGHAIVELAPKAELKPEVKYEVVDQANTAVVEFTTTKIADKSPPTWKGLKRADYVKQPGRCCMCNTGAPHIMVEAAALADDTSRTFIFGVWVADAAGKLDYTQPAATYIPSWGNEFYLGNPSTCGNSTFAIPKVAKLKIGVRPFDLAGNAGTPADRTVDLAKPKVIPD